MNNRRRARIKALKRECRTKLKRYRNYHAASAMIRFQYAMAINRIQIGVDFFDAAFKDFTNLTLGVPYKRNLIWKKAVRTARFAPLPRRLIDPYDFKLSFPNDKTRMIIVHKPLTVGPTWNV